MHVSKLNAQIGALRVSDLLIAVLLIAAAIGLYEIFSYFGYPENGRFAGFCVIPIAGVIYINWKYIRSPWFIAAISVFIIIHVTASVFYKMPTKGIPGAIFWPFEIIDFFAMSALVKIMEIFCKRN